MGSARAARGFLVSFFVPSSHGLCLSIARNKIADAANIRIVELHLSHQINPQASSHNKIDASDQIPPLLLWNHTLLQDAFQKRLMDSEEEE